MDNQQETKKRILMVFFIINEWIINKILPHGRIGENLGSSETICMSLFIFSENKKKEKRYKSKNYTNE